MSDLQDLETTCPQCGSVVNMSCLSMIVLADKNQPFKATITCKGCGYNESRFIMDNSETGRDLECEIESRIRRRKANI